ncbi:MAG: hypothetical protein ACOY93_01965 [Bacillota bacterium]
MKRTWNPALLVGVAIILLWAGVWLIGYLTGFQGEPRTFFKGQ